MTRQPDILQRLAVTLGLLLSPSLLCAAEVLDCLITPSQTVELGSQTMGLLSKVSVNRGDYVQAGQVVAELESGVEQANVALARERAEDVAELNQAKARLKFLQEQETRANELFGRDLGSREALEEAEMERILAEHARVRAEVNIRLARLELNLNEEVLDQKSITSPIDGIVMEQAMHAGEFVNETSHILRLAQTDPLYVEVYVPLDYYNQVSEGDELSVSLRRPLEGQYLARVDVVDDVVDASSGTFGVRLVLDNPEREIPAGVRCEVLIGE